MHTQEHGTAVMNDAIVISNLSVHLTQHGSLRCFGTGFVRSANSFWHPKFDWMLDRNNVVTIRFDPNSKHAPLQRIAEVETELRLLLNQMSSRLITTI